MKRFSILVTLASAFILVISVVAADKDNSKQATKSKPKEPTATKAESDEDKWMLAKLDVSQQLFAGLTRGDLEEVKLRARGLLVVNVLEGWMRKNEFVKKSAYQGQLNAFEFANKELIRHADDGNIDGALDSWTRLGRSCVECHKLIRDAK